MVRPIALLLTFATGLTGLVYEVAWQKYLATLLGSHSEATAAVLAIYLGGLATGYAWFGGITERRVRAATRAGSTPGLLLLYGLIEIGIGAYAFLFPYLFSAAQALSVAVPLPIAGLSFAFDVLLTILLIGPPTVLMGGTIPILTQALASNLEDATRVHAWIYASNTAGAFVGALAGGFVLIPLLGLDGVVRLVAGVNILAGSTFVALRSGEAAIAASTSQQTEREVVPSIAGYAVVALLAGFAMMALQTAFNRVGGLALGASHFTFSMVVAVFVLSIALGSFVVSALRTIPAWAIAGSQWLLVLLLALLYGVAPDLGYWTHVARSLFRDELLGFYPYHQFVFTALLGVLVVPIGLSGALLPLLFHHLRHTHGDLGSVAGRLYSWNTVGSLLGALIGGYALLFWVDLDDLWKIAVAALTVGAGLLTALVLPQLRLLSVGAVAGVGFVLFQLPGWDVGRLAIGTFRTRAPIATTSQGPDAFFRAFTRDRRVDFYTDDPTSSVAVTTGTTEKVANPSIVTNGKSDGNLRGDYTTMSMAGLLPALIADDERRSFVIGWGTGVTAGELAALDDTEEVVVAEISPGVIEAARYFEHGNLGASEQPKVEIVRSDAYRALLRSEGRFGVIVSEPSNPWVTGVEMLFSREFLTAARDRLTEGGVYVQWFHQYETDLETVEIVLRTYTEVFPGVAVWYTAGADILLLGFKSAEPEGYDLGRMSERFEREDFRAGFERGDIPTLPELLGHEILPLGVLHAAGLEGPTHTLRKPILSHHAARAFFGGKSASVPRVSRGALVAGNVSLLQQRWEGHEPSIEELRTQATHACDMVRQVACVSSCAALEAAAPGEGVAVLDALPAAKRKFRTTIPDPLVRKLAVLYQGKAMPGDPTGLQQANAVTTLYETYFLHALPFERATLDVAWRRCAMGTKVLDGCVDGRSRAEERLGAF